MTGRLRRLKPAELDRPSEASTTAWWANEGLLDMVPLTGLYLTVCAIVNAFKVPVPVGIQSESSAQ